MVIINTWILAVPVQKNQFLLIVLPEFVLQREFEEPILGLNA